MPTLRFHSVTLVAVLSLTGCGGGASSRFEDLGAGGAPSVGGMVTGGATALPPPGVGGAAGSAAHADVGSANGGAMAAAGGAAAGDVGAGGMPAQSAGGEPVSAAGAGGANVAGTTGAGGAVETGGATAAGGAGGLVNVGSGGTPPGLCDCLSGPCCDGCAFRPKTFVCKRVVFSTACDPVIQRTVCGGSREAALVTHWDTVSCSGESSDCDGARLVVEETKDCSIDGEQCLESGSGSAKTAACTACK